MKSQFHLRVLSPYRAKNTSLLYYEDLNLNAIKVTVVAYGKDFAQRIGAMWGKCSVVVVSVVLVVYTVTRRIPTFRLTTDRIYDGGPIRL